MKPIVTRSLGASTPSALRTERGITVGAANAAAAVPWRKRRRLNDDLFGMMVGSLLGTEAHLRLVIPSGNDIIHKLCHDVRAGFVLRGPLEHKTEAMLSANRIEVFA